MNPLTDWRTFYNLLGESAATLTGLQFVTVALLADMPANPGETEASETFATPNVVHFATVLVLAAVLSAPWSGIFAPAVLWGAAGALGVVYIVAILRRMRTQTAYRPVLEDWMFHVFLPLIAYAALAVSAWAARGHPAPSLFAVAFAALLLLLIAIHNAWDNVTYLVQKKRTHNAQ